MEKITSPLKSKVRWLKTKVLMLMFFGVFFSFFGANAQTTVTIGTGTSSNGSTGYPAIFANYYYGNKIQILYEATELTAGGATANSYINSVAFDVDNLNSVPTLVNFTVKVYTTSETDPLGNTTFFNGNHTTASIGSYTVAATGWNTLTLTNPIIWNGCDNIVVEICSNDNDYTSSGNASTKYSSVSGSNTYVRWYRADNTTVCPSTTGPDTSTNRPNIKFGLTANTANCGYVCNFDVVAQSATSIALSWLGTGSSYVIEYGLEGFTQGSTAGTVVTTTNLTQTISSLTANTNYDIYIKQVCSSGPSAGAYGPVKVTTPCSTYSYLYENFDTTATGSSSNPSLPDCWSYIDEITTTGYGYVEANTALSGTNSFRLYRSNTTGNAADNLVLISPQTDNLGNGTKQLRFYAMATNTNTTNTLQIVRADGTTSSDTFTIIQSITVDHTGYEEYIVDLPVTTDDYFGFRLAHNGATASVDINIDDIYLEDLDVCMPPTNITISNIGQTTADISWTASTSTGTASYEYEIRSLGAPGSGSNGLGANGTITGTTASVTGLSPSVNYSVYVRSICGTTPGRWTHIPETFQTLCGVITGSFFEGFENTATGSSSNNTFPECWSYIDDVTSSGYGYVSTSADRSGSKGYYTYRSSATSTSYNGDVILVSPETNNLGNGTKQLRFWARVSSTSYESNHKFEVYTMDGDTITANKTLLQGNIPLKADWQEFIIPLTQTTDDYFAFSFERDGGAAYVYLDDIYYEDLSPCIFPMNINVTNITGTTATISWNASLATGVTGYDYEIRNVNDSIVKSGNVSAPATSVNVTGLTGATEYTLYVRSVCGTSQGIWTTFPVSFMTACPLYTGFYENFDTTSTGGSSNPSVPLCWSYIDDIGSSGYGYTTSSSTTSLSPSNFFRFYRTNNTGNAAESATLISPETDSLGNGAKQVRFYARSYSSSSSYDNSKLEVVTMDGNTATANVTVLASYMISGDTYNEYVVPFPITTDTHFGFRIPHNGGTSTTYVYIDDVYYEEIPAPTIDTITFVDNACFGETNGSATVVVEGGALPLTYEWLPSGGSLSTADSLAAGIYTITVTDAKNRSVTDTVTISSPDEILMDFTYEDISCNGQADGSASVNPSGGVGPYLVLWSTNDTTDTISNLIAGSYSVTITDSTGCSVTEDFDVIEPAVLNAMISAQSDVTSPGGNDGSATIAVTGGTTPYTYSWSPSGGTSDTATGLTAGTYTVDITDASGCTTQETVVITEPIPLTITLVSQTDVSCNGGNDGELIIDVVGDHPPFTYSWTPAVGNSNTISNLPAGTYTVVVTDTLSSTETVTYTITEPAALSVSVGSITHVSCNSGNDGSATAAVLGGTPPYTYAWSSGETTATAVNLSAGNNFVTVTDANGCQKQEFFNIVQPSPIVIDAISVTNASCNGQSDGAVSVSVSGGVAPYTYSWSNGQSTADITNLSGGTYVLTVTDGNGCNEVKSFVVVDPPYVFPPTAANQGFCSDNNPQLSDVVVTGSNIQWYDAAIGGNALPATTALINGVTYYASQTVGGCESPSRAAVQVSLSQSVPLTTTTMDVCYNSKIQDVMIDGLNHNQLKWYSSASTPISLSATTTLTSGTYHVSTFTNNICESTRYTIQITVLPNVPAPIVTTQVLCGSSHTVNDLTIGTVTGGSLNWYTSPQASTPLAATAQVYSGTYYVEQVIGSCNSVRVAVPVQVIPVTAPALSNITVCSGTTIGDYNADAPTAYVWYSNNTTTTPLAESTMISSGTFYIAEQISGCISNRAQVSVVVNQRPSSPTGQTLQRFSFPATVADLQMNQQGVLWFASEGEALDQINQLLPTTPLIHGAKYYGILANIGCGSLPTEVEVDITVSTNNFDLTNLKYYPNPTDSELNISYVETITKVEVFNIAGQRVLSKEFDANEVKVDLSGFGSGTYMVRIETETASQFVKVVKK